MSDANLQEIGPRLAEAIKQAAKARLDEADSAKGNRITEALLSGVIDAYADVNPEANAIFASAHQNSIHISEQHPDLKYENQKPDRDLTLSGGTFQLVGEMETSGGPKAVVADFRKLKGDPVEKVKCLATRALSFKQQGRHHGMLQRASAEDGGCYIGIEVQLPKKGRSSKAAVAVVCFGAGERLDIA